MAKSPLYPALQSRLTRTMTVGGRGSWSGRALLAGLDVYVDPTAKAMRDEEMLTEIEDFLEGFDQPTYRE
jgi:hypothetical protein